MLKKMFTFVFMFFVFSVFSQITEVTVYKDRALITRVIEEQAKEGIGEMVFKNISLKSNLDSIRAKGFTGKESSLKILDIRVEKNYKKITNAELDGLKKEIEVEKNSLIRFNAGIIRISEQKKNIEIFSEKAKEAVNDNLNKGSFNAKQWEEALNIYAVKLQRFDEEIFNLNDEIKKTNDKLVVLEDKLRRYFSGNSIYTLDVFVKYQLAKASTVKIELSYLALGAGWNPLYDSRFDSKAKELVFEYFAKVYQDTGEEWNNVRLTLSTARPDLSGRVPDIYPWELNFNDRQSPLKKVSSNRSDKIAETEAAPMASKELKDFKKEEEVFAEVESSGLSVSYIIASKADIISGKKDIKVTIAGSIKLIPELSRVILPRHNNNAFLSAKIKNDSLFVFLAGEINLYVDDTFIGKSSIPEINSQEVFDFSLGRDPQVVSELKLENVEKTKVFSKKKEKRKYAITISNNSAEDINILVKDVLPKSIQVNKVNVRIIKIEPDTKDIEDGSIYKWNLKINKGAKIKITEEWEVEYPEEGYIIGL